MPSHETIFFILFIAFIIFVLLIDLLLVGRKSHEVSTKEAAIWSIIWVTLGLSFTFFLSWKGHLVHGIENFDDLQSVVNKYASHLVLFPDNYAKSINVYNNHMAIDYITGYLLEKSLSVDNLFVMMMILTAFSVRKISYKPILFWGILGAIILRSIFIFAGAALVKRFDWILLIFGAFLIYSAIKMFFDKEEKIEPQNHKLIKFFSKHFPIYPRYVSTKFFFRKDKRLMFTPLFLVLIFIEFSDLVFAFDSIPAIFSVTLDPYVVFFSNIFAILGLRALFFLLIKIVDKFHYLKIGVSILLLFIGVKLLLHSWLDKIGFENYYSLIFIVAVLLISVLLSLIFPKKEDIALKELINKKDEIIDEN